MSRSRFSIELIIFFHKGGITFRERSCGSFFDGILNLFLVDFVSSGFFCTWLFCWRSLIVHAFIDFMLMSLFNAEKTELCLVGTSRDYLRFWWANQLSISLLVVRG